MPSNAVWACDHGPVTIYRAGLPVLLDFHFNGWGGKYASDLDGQTTARLHQIGASGATPRESVDLILEGGSIETDGQGTLLATAQCLLNPNRNDLDQATLEQRLRDALGFTRFLWLRHGGEKKAVTECFGCFFDENGKVVDRITQVGLQFENLYKIPHIFAFACGSRKAEAIKAYMPNAPHQTWLITDEGASNMILKGK